MGGMTINDGGSAFPPQVVMDSDNVLREASMYGVASGMSLRDYFAAKAMSSLLLQGYEPGDALAAQAYRAADAMLRQGGHSK